MHPSVKINRLSGYCILAWVLIAVVVFGILGMCYWEIFGKF